MYVRRYVPPYVHKSQNHLCYIGDFSLTNRVCSSIIITGTKTVLIKENTMNNNYEDLDLQDHPSDLVEFEQYSLKMDIQSKLTIISNELNEGFDFIRPHPKTVTFFGGARFQENHKYYHQARSLANLLSSNDFVISTGGGPGIMEAANRGANESQGNEHSLGMGIQLPHEQGLNKYVTASTKFRYFFTRKVILAFGAKAYIFFPGGFGTLDEFFEIITLIQTKKIPPIPLILFGYLYWNPVISLINDHLFHIHQTISEEDMGLYTVTEDADSVLDIVLKAC